VHIARDIISMAENAREKAQIEMKMDVFISPWMKKAV
jgi:hypothetical protein